MHSVPCSVPRTLLLAVWVAPASQDSNHFPLLQHVGTAAPKNSGMSHFRQFGSGSCVDAVAK